MGTSELPYRRSVFSNAQSPRAFHNSQAAKPLDRPIPRQEHAMKRIRFRAGFTLIELMVVVVILGILGAMAFGYYMNVPDEVRWKTAKLEMVELRKALDAYRLEHGQYPEKLDDLANIDLSKARNPFSKREFDYERGGDGTSYTIKFLGRDDAEGDAPIPDEDVIMTERG
jgi:general secretion pathway protein G